jgi:hypothetical protein
MWCGLLVNSNNYKMRNIKTAVNNQNQLQSQSIIVNVRKYVPGVKKKKLN